MTQSSPSHSAREELFGPTASIPGMVRFRGELAQRGLNLTRFLVQMSAYEQRADFLADEEAAMQAAGLTQAERDMVRQRDYVAMLNHGVNIYAIAKSGGAIFGHPLPVIGKQMREHKPSNEGNEHG